MFARLARPSSGVLMSTAPCRVVTRALVPSMPRSTTALARTSAAAPSIPNVTTRPRNAPIRAAIRGSSALATSSVEATGSFQDLGLGVGDRVERGKEAEVRLAHVGPDPDVRLGDAHQRADLPRVIHAQFDDGHFRPPPQLDQGQRQTNVVVEIPAVADHAVPRLEKVARHVLGRGLAGAAGDRHDLRARRPADAVRQRLQRLGGVVDFDDDSRRRWAARSRPPRGTTTPAAPASIAAAANAAPSNRSPRMPTYRSPAFSVRVSIDTSANSRAASPAVTAPPICAATQSAVSRMAGGPSAPDPIGSGPAAWVISRRPISSAGGSAPRAPPPRRRTAASEPPMTWYFSCPLPATSTTSPARASSIALVIAARRSTMVSRRCALSRPRVGRRAARVRACRA